MAFALVKAAVLNIGIEARDVQLENILLASAITLRVILFILVNLVQKLNIHDATLHLGRYNSVIVFTPVPSKI